jgi:hypothetical protein
MDHIEISDQFRVGMRQLREVADALEEVCRRDPNLGNN